MNNNTTNQDKRYHCSICDEGFSEKKYLSNHLNNHKKEKSIPCQKCNKVFSNPSYLKRHEKSKHTTKKGDFSCKTCSKLFVTKYRLNLHTQNCQKKQTKKAFNCDQCPKEYSRIGYLQQHITVVHLGLKTYKCSQCDKTYTDSTPLRKHILTDHKAKGLYQCPNCPSNFSSSPYLDAHIYRNHTIKDHTVTCKFCGKKIHKYQIKQHEQTNDLFKSYV